MKTAVLENRYLDYVSDGTSVGSVLKQAASAFTTWNRRRRAIAELRGLSDAQLKDIGIARADIPSLVDDMLK